MKQINENKYLKMFKFSSLEEGTTFFDNQKAKNKLFIGDIFGDNYYCYVCYHSLTREVQFVLSFRSDEREDNLNFLFWEGSLVIDTGTNIYLIADNLSIKASFEVTTPLIGFYLVNKKFLLLLEEAYLRVVDYNGWIVKSELFDLIEDFEIKDSLLFLRTSEGDKNIQLI